MFHQLPKFPRLQLLAGVLQGHAVAFDHQAHQRRVAAADVRHLAEPLATQRLAACQEDDDQL